MVTGEDCSCVDTTEPSNLTSLRSDDATSAINSDVNAVCTETVDKRNDVVEIPKGIIFKRSSKRESKLYIQSVRESRQIFFFLKNVCDLVSHFNFTLTAHLLHLPLNNLILSAFYMQKRTASVPMHRWSRLIA